MRRPLSGQVKRCMGEAWGSGGILQADQGRPRTEVRQALDRDPREGRPEEARVCLAQAEHPRYPSGVGGLSPGPPGVGKGARTQAQRGTWGGRHLPLVHLAWPVVEGLASRAQEQAESRGSELDSRSQTGSGGVYLCDLGLVLPQFPL